MPRAGLPTAALPRGAGSPQPSPGGCAILRRAHFRDAGDAEDNGADSTVSWGLQNAGNACQQEVEGLPLLGELLSACRRDFVETRAAIVFREPPFCLHVVVDQ